MSEETKAQRSPCPRILLSQDSDLSRLDPESVLLNTGLSEQTQCINIIRWLLKTGLVEAHPCRLHFQFGTECALTLLRPGLCGASWEWVGAEEEAGGIG